MDLGIRRNKRKKTQTEPRNEPIKLNNQKEKDNTFLLAVQQFLQFTKKDGGSHTGNQTFGRSHLLKPA